MADGPLFAGEDYVLRRVAIDARGHGDSDWSDSYNPRSASSTPAGFEMNMP